MQLAERFVHNLLMLGPPGSGEAEYITKMRSNDPAASVSAFSDAA